jgi:ABC-type nitrate/sulfonate/bicarbonate transport system substrate-binding protein
MPVGCSFRNAEAVRPLDEQKEIKKVTVVLDWTPNTNHTGVYAAKNLGYYLDEGLDVEILPPGSAGPAQLIAANQGDFAFSYQEEVTIARTMGLPIKAVAAVIQHNTSGFASPVDRGIDSPREFEGKRYGGWGSPAEEAMLKALMSQEKADFKKVDIINIGSADFFSSIKKDIDFAWIFWGWTGIESELKGITLNFQRLRDYHEALDFYSPVLITSEKSIRDNPDMVAKFVKATTKGYQYSIQEPEKSAQLLLDAVPELNRDLLIASQKYLAREYQGDASRWGEMETERWKNYADWMYAQGLIEKPLDFEQAFTNEFLPGK